MLRRKFRTEKARRRFRYATLNDAAFVSIGLLVMLGALLFLVRSPWLTVSFIEVSGTKVASPTEIEKATRSAMAGSYLKLVPRAFTPAISKKRIAAFIKEEIPRVKDVAVSIRGFRSLSITVSERNPVALWCGDVVPDIAALKEATEAGAIPGEWCYLADTAGFIFDEAPGMSASLYPRFWGAISNGNAIGASFADAEQFIRLMTFVQLLKDQSIGYLGVLLVDETEGELYLADGTRLLFVHTGDLAQTAEHIASVLNSGTVPRGEGAVEYIDMRFPNRAYFKRIGEPAPLE